MKNIEDTPTVSEKRAFFKKTKFWIVILGIVGGIGILAAVLVQDQPPWLSSILAAFGSTLLSISIATMFLSTFDVIDFVLGKTTDILVQNSYLSKLSENALKTLRKQATEILLKHHRLHDAGDDRAFIDCMQSEIDEFMDSCYLVKYAVDITFKEEGDHMVKTMRSDMTFMNPTNKKFERNIINKVRMKRVAGLEDKEHFQIEACELNGNPIDALNAALVFEPIPESSIPDSLYYKFMVTCEEKFTIDNGTRLVLTTTRKVPKSDRNTVIRFPYPGKEFTVDFCYAGENIVDLYAWGFCNNVRDKMEMYPVGEGMKTQLHLCMRDCFLTGDGVILYCHEREE